jgi:hypothetical protein
MVSARNGLARSPNRAKKANGSSDAALVWPVHPDQGGDA